MRDDEPVAEPRLSVVSSRLPKEFGEKALVAALIDPEGKIAQCYRTALRAQPWLGGSMEVKVRLRNGCVIAEVVKRQVNDPFLAECAEWALESFSVVVEGSSRGGIEMDAEHPVLLLSLAPGEKPYDYDQSGTLTLSFSPPPSGKGERRSVAPIHPPRPPASARPSPLCRDPSRYTFACYSKLVGKVSLPRSIPNPHGVVRVLHLDTDAGAPAWQLEQLKEKALEGATACYEEGLVQSANLAGSMELRFGRYQASIEEASDLDPKTQRCVAGILAETDFPRPIKIRLTFEPGEPRPPLSISPGFQGWELCHDRVCLERTIRDVEEQLVPIKGGPSRAVHYGNIRDGVAECWQRHAPDIKGEMSFELFVDHDGHPTLARIKRSLSSELDRCVANLLAAHTQSRQRFDDDARFLLTLKFIIYGDGVPKVKKLEWPAELER